MLQQGVVCCSVRNSMLHTLVADAWSTLLLHTTVAHFCCILLLHTLSSGFCGRLLMHTNIANYCCRYSLQTCVADYNRVHLHLRDCVCVCASVCVSVPVPVLTHCNTLQHTAIHSDALQYTAAHCNTLQHARVCTHVRTHVQTFSCDPLAHTRTQVLDKKTMKLVPRSQLSKKGVDDDEDDMDTLRKKQVAYIFTNKY